MSKIPEGLSSLEIGHNKVWTEVKRKSVPLQALDAQSVPGS